ncbi:hypothetical protein C8J57DRAFT_1525806 [Mycena rebaudengoi]|nr:hypothetical protein C8J57DRAFT_1525806 [Mycena rebaudengoi]
MSWLSILFLLGAVNARFTFVDYLANITVGGQDFTVIVDTGSVDDVDYPTGIQLQESQWDPSAAPFPDVKANLTFGSGLP